MLRYAMVGGLSGLFNGLVGSFGGVISIILIRKYMYKSQKVAQTTTLSYIWILSLVSLLIYGIEDYINIKKYVFLTCGGIIGTLIGTKLLLKFKNDTVEYLFGLIMIITGVMVLL